MVPQISAKFVKQTTMDSTSALKVIHFLIKINHSQELKALLSKLLKHRLDSRDIMSLNFSNILR